MIYSALYYTGSLARGDLIVRDNRFYGGKYSEGLRVWWALLRKHYPKERVVLFCDTASPIPLEPLLHATLREPWDVEGGPQYDVDGSGDPPLVQVRWLAEHSGKYFWPMQRNLVEAMCLAYEGNHDLFWLDADAFLNTNIYPLVEGYDVAAPTIAHHQMTMDSVCTFISAERLHALDGICDLPTYLHALLKDGPENTRMHSFQEGGLYKTFCYGKTRAIAAHIELSHLSCYDHFMSFLKRNPLNTPEWRALVSGLSSIDWSRMPGVERAFHDMDFSVQAKETFA